MSRALPKLGVFLAYWPWIEPAEQRDLARLADRSGLDSLWVAEAWGQEVASTLGWLAASTENIGLGSAVMQIPARKPTTAAMVAATIDMLSGGRCRVGLGLSGPRVSESWYGESFADPLMRARRYVKVLRLALAGVPISLAASEGSDDPATPLKLLASPIQERIPIYLGALGPRAVDQCFEIADGWMPLLVGTDLLTERPRPARQFDIAPLVPLAVADTVEAARDAVRPWLAFYFGLMGTPQKHFLVELAERQGYGVAAREVQRLYLAGDRVAAASALTPELIEASAIATTPAGLADRLAAYGDAGADTVIAVVLGDRPSAVEALGSAQASG